MAESRVDLAVIGGGLMGLSTAIAAARDGLSVTVLEAETCGRHASGASAGGVRSLNRHPAEIPLARAALGLWRQAPALFGGDCGFKASGQLRVAEDEAGLDGLKSRLALVEGMGFGHERLIGRNDLFDRAPALGRHCLGALVVEDDGFAEPLEAVCTFRKTAAGLGVAIVEHAAVASVGADGGGGLVIAMADGREVRAGAVANCAGAWAGRLAAAIGEPVEMRAAALQMAVTERLPRFVTQTVGTQGRKLSLKQSRHGTVVIGGGFEGTPDLTTGASAMSFTGVAANMRNAASLFPQLDGARIVRTWAGIEGMMADEIPVLGPSGTLPGLVHAFGFSGHGFALCPLVGRIVADLVQGREPPVPIAPFRVERFHRDGAGRKTG